MKSNYGFEILEMVKLGEGDYVSTESPKEVVERIVKDAVETDRLDDLFHEAEGKFTAMPIWAGLYWAALGAKTALEKEDG